MIAYKICLQWYEDMFTIYTPVNFVHTMHIADSDFNVESINLDS